MMRRLACIDSDVATDAFGRYYLYLPRVSCWFDTMIVYYVLDVEIQALGKYSLIGIHSSGRMNNISCMFLPSLLLRS